MTEYVDIDYVKLVGQMLPDEIDAVESANPGFTAANALAVSRLFDSILAKRYATPVREPVPESLKYNVAQVVVQRLWRRHGDSPTNQAKTDEVNEAAKDAIAWARDGANSEIGLVELPAREGAQTDADGVSKGGPFVYSEQSPYTWNDVQADAVRSGEP